MKFTHSRMLCKLQYMFVHTPIHIIITALSCIIIEDNTLERDLDVQRWSGFMYISPTTLMVAFFVGVSSCQMISTAALYIVSVSGFGDTLLSL